MKEKSSTIETILEYVLDFVIRKVLRLTYCCVTVKRSEEIDGRAFSNCFDSSLYLFDQQIGMEVSLSTEKLIISARNYVITIIEFRQRLGATYKIKTAKRIDHMACRNRSNKIFALANDLFYACFLKDLGVTDDDRKTLSNAISLVPYLILSLCKLVTFKNFGFIGQQDKKTIDISAGIEDLKLYGRHEVFMLSAFHQELLLYAAHTQLLLAKSFK